MLSRREDIAFWKDVQSRAEQDPHTSVGLGIVTLLITDILGDFAPEAFTGWTVRRLPSQLRLWVNVYGRRIVFGDTPGSKLYLLLQQTLESEGLRQRRSVRQGLLPSRLPSLVVRAAAGETLRRRISRYQLQIYFVFSRLRFHVVEGLRYIRESYRWRQYVEPGVRMMPSLRPQPLPSMPSLQRLTPGLVPGAVSRHNVVPCAAPSCKRSLKEAIFWK